MLDLEELSLPSKLSLLDAHIKDMSISHVNELRNIVHAYMHDVPTRKLLAMLNSDAREYMSMLSKILHSYMYNQQVLRQVSRDLAVFAESVDENREEVSMLLNSYPHPNDSNNTTDQEAGSPFVTKTRARAKAKPKTKTKTTRSKFRGMV